MHLVRALRAVGARRQLPELRRRPDAAPDPPRRRARAQSGIHEAHREARLRKTGVTAPRALHVVFYGGFAASTLDIVNAIVFWQLYSATPALRILQAIAAGVLGKEAFAGGAGTAALGLALHYLIAFGMAFAYWFAAARFPALLRHPVAAGLAYGAATWALMNYVVLPLSRAQPPPFIRAWFLDGILAHLVLVGLLLAFVARWSANRR
jgi:hypothetical protein